MPQKTWERPPCPNGARRLGSRDLTSEGSWAQRVNNWDGRLRVCHLMTCPWRTRLLFWRLVYLQHHTQRWKRQLKGATSRYFESFLPDGLNCGSSVGKLKNNGLLRKKKTKGLVLKQKGTRMAEDGEDWNGLEMTILKSLAIFFKIHERWRSSFKCLGNSVLSLELI